MALFLMGRKGKPRPSRKPGRLEWAVCAERLCRQRTPAISVFCPEHLHALPVILRNQIARADGAEWVRLVGLGVDFLEARRHAGYELEDLEPGINAPGYVDALDELEDGAA